ncbi:uncharacterized protein LOC132195933 [Neocloeon triangulifer]|uniref:uncharacterized protein LOC132195933 n=1 Tax=Neocloeon triangulifer TaxID=2078957 RepID=UPI00286F06BF|nr:uncharacterized protein LOC132195933 [Neocloeon triangulifer]
MRLLLRRVNRRRQASTSSISSAGGRQTPGASWENTRSCPGSLKCHRRELPHQSSSTYTCGLQRHNSDPGSLKARSPSPAAVDASRRFHAADSPSGSSVAIDLHGHADSRWSLYKPSAHWDEVFDPGRDSHLHSEFVDEQTFNLKQLMEAGRPRSRLRCLALVFAILYLAYAFYVTISRVNRACKPITGGIRSTPAPTTTTTNPTTDIMAASAKHN